jgi:putative phosphoesterase
MRILIVSDIHANWAALRAINERYDACLFLGDLVDYGTAVTPCIDWVKAHATHSVRGNHDHGAAQNVSVFGQGGFKYLTAVTRPVTVSLLKPDERRFLADLPVTKSVTLGGRRFLMVHATPRDPLDEFAPPEVEFWQRRLEGIEADVICVGHTHMQYELAVGNQLVINPGSVGLPRDGDPRAGYAVIDGDRFSFHRVEYDVEEAVRMAQESTLPEKAKEGLALVYRSGRLPPGR